MGGGDQQSESAAKPVLMYGWLAKGLLFTLIGALTIELARRGYTTDDADQSGALQALADAPAGRVLVVIVAIGLFLYAAWQMWSAFARDAGDSAEFETLVHTVRRIGWFFLGLVYAFIAVTGLQIALPGLSDSGGGGSEKASPDELTELLFQLPGGRVMVTLIGIGTGVVGAYHLWKGIRQGYLGDIDTSDLSTSHRRFLKVIGTAGFAARSLLLFTTGWLFISAAVDYNPDKAAGIDESLRALSRAPLGSSILLACGLGLAAAGIYDMVTFQRQRIAEQ